MAIFTNQVGYAEESTYGTRVAPTRFIDFTAEDLTRAQAFRESAGIRAGSIVRASAGTTTVAKGAAGSVTHEIATKAFGMLFKHAFRNAPVINQPNAGSAPTVYDQTFTLGTSPLSLTCQVGRPKGDGSGVQPFDYLGCVVTTWEFHQVLDAYATVQLGLDTASESTAQTLATASYAAGTSLFHDGQCSVTVNAAAFEPQEITVSGDNQLATDRYVINAGAPKKQPINSDFTGITGALAGEFKDMTAYNLFVNGTIVAITVDWVGATIASTYHNQLKITMPACRIDGETPNTSAPGILDENTPFTVLDDGTNAPITILYRGTDTAI